jgi:hypothetical protein
VRADGRNFQADYDQDGLMDFFITNVSGSKAV